MKNKINFEFHGIIDHVINNHNTLFDALTNLSPTAEIAHILDTPRHTLEIMKNSDNELLRNITNMIDNAMLNRVHQVPRPWNVAAQNIANMVRITADAKNPIDLLKNPQKTSQALKIVLSSIPNTLPSNKIFNTFIGKMLKKRGNMI